MKKLLIFFVFLINSLNLVSAQNLNIGGVKPTIARFEVSGAAGLGKTSAIFTPGDFVDANSAISLQRDPATIGFNQYQDAQTGIGKNIGTGFASTISLASGLVIKQFSPGVFGSPTNASTMALNLVYGNLALGGSATYDKRFSVIRKTENSQGTAVFTGSQNSSHFNYGITEDTYIRSGKNGGKVIINNHGNANGITPNVGRTSLVGKVSIGLGGSIDPGLSLQIQGALAMNKHIYYDVSSNETNGYEVNNANIITITNNLDQLYPSIYLSRAGCTDGQFLAIHSSCAKECSTAVGYLQPNESFLLMYKVVGGWARL